MVSVIPAERTPYDVIGRDVGKALQGVLPGAVQQGFQRQTGLNALDQAQKDIELANGDPYKIAMAFARVGAQNPALERSLGPLAQTAMMNAKVGRAFPGVQGNQPILGQEGINQPSQMVPPTNVEGGKPDLQQPKFASPGPFNIMSQQEMDAEAKRYAVSVQDPNAYNSRFNQLTAQNETATSQRNMLEDAALKAHVPPSELPRFMVVNKNLDFRNPSEWAQEAKRNYAKVKSNDDKLERAFIPGIGNALLGKKRPEALKRLEQPVQDLVKSGLEQETRKKLTDEYLSPTEIEGLIHPLTQTKEKAIKSLPRGQFPAETGEELSFFAPIKKFKSFEEVRETNPQALEHQQNRLADFFLENVDNDTSLLVLRDKLWNDKDYDWRQIGPAIREAEKRGLKLTTQQSTEMADVESQAPMQSLPHIFQDWDRFTSFIRGNR